MKTKNHKITIEFETRKEMNLFWNEVVANDMTFYFKDIYFDDEKVTHNNTDE